MKKFLLSFLLYFTFHLAFCQGEIILVNSFAGDGPGTLYEAINKANASTSSSGRIDFRKHLRVGDYIPYSLTIYLDSPLPVLTKENWKISNYFYVMYPDGTFGERNSNITINGNKLPGPALVIKGKNSTCDIPWDNFENFKATRYTVTNTNDSGPGSLREALEFSYTTKAKDSIFFNITGQGPHVINIPTPLPDISKNILIDGSTQPGFIDGKETIVLQGNGQFIGLSLYHCSNVEIYGLTLRNFSNGIGSSPKAYYDSNGLAYIYIGKEGKGNLLISNTGETNASGNGILINVPTSSNIYICNNFIGTNANGDPGLGNSRSGIKIKADQSVISDNVISGNGNHGISSADVYSVDAGKGYRFSGKITGNKIGTDPSGSIALPNTGHGIQLYTALGLFIGGELESDRNIISGNSENGINVGVQYWYTANFKDDILQTYIYNNFIGTDISGKNPIPNGGNGITTNIYGIYHIGKKGAENIIAFNKSEAISNGNSAVVRNNIIFNNEGSISSTALAPPVINYRSPDKISGTSTEGTVVQLFYDNGFNNNAQGKDFIAEVYTNSGNWTYSGQLTNPCAVTAIAIDTTKKQSSPFSHGSKYSIGPDITFCEGDSTVLDALDGFSNYTWSTGQTTKTISIKQAGVYIVKVDNGCIYTDTIEAFQRIKPVINLGRDTIILYPDQIILDAGNPGATYLWKPAYFLSGPQRTVSQTGEYSVTVSYDRCSNSDTINVISISKPYVNLGPDNFLCEKDSVVLNAQNPYSQYLWSTGDTTESVTINKSGTYWVRVQNKYFPPSSDTIKISFSTPQINLGNDTILCTGQFLTLKNPIPGSTSRWSNYSTNNEISVGAAGKYYVTVKLGSCLTSDTIMVTRKDRPSINIGADTYLCEGDSINLDAGANATYYQWSTGDTGRYLNIKKGGTYTVRVSHNAKCFASDTIVLRDAQCNTVSGTLFQNCTWNTGDQGMLGKLIEFKEPSLQHTYYAYTDANGFYSTKLPLGNYQVYPAPNRTISIFCPEKPYNINLNNSPLIDKIDFGIMPNAVIDLSVSLGVPSNIRLATDVQLSLQYENKGTATSSGQVFFIKDAFMNLTSTSPGYDELAGDTLIWNFTAMAPGAVNTIKLNVNLPVNNSLIGKYILNKAGIRPMTGDINPENNYSEGKTLATYAFDPNDKLSDKGVECNITVNDSIISYTINFQNVGNDTAYTVVIKDTISEYLNLLSFESGASSHPYKLDITGKGIITWTFPDIMLPDSTRNLEGSSGFITYTIRLKKDLPLGTVISNPAAIYFDLAPPVITNTTKHTIVNDLFSQNISFPEISDKEYLDRSVNLNTNISSELPIQYAWSGPVSVIDGIAYIEGTGEARIRAYQNGGNSYLPAEYIDRTFTIHKSDQMIIFDSIPDKSLDEPFFNLSAKGGASGNPVVFIIVSGPAQLEDDRVILSGEGTVIIKAIQAGNSNFHDAHESYRSFNINSIVTGIDNESSKHNLNIFPNPSSDYIQIILNNNEDGEIKMMSLTGSVILTDQIISGKAILDIGEVMPGSYVMLINTRAGEVMQKVIITR